MNSDASSKLFEVAKRLMPGGVSSPVRAISPYPFYVSRAQGPHLWDIDGNKLVDYCLAYGPMVLGHRHPQVMKRVIEQLDRGWLYGTPSELEVRLAERIVDLYPGIDMLRFVNTGTEATMAALRIARGYTGKDRIVKVEGGFHGAHDSVLVKAGSGATTLGIPDSLGVPKDTAKNTIQVPYNDLGSIEASLSEFEGEVAAVIMEPVLGNIGPILPEAGYLEGVRRVTKDHDVLLIFDEVITGFRLSLGGAQTFYNVVPDMTTLGKIIGGGFPIGVVGGKRELLEMVAPSGGIYQAGTFNGSPTPLAAGMATLDVLEKERVLERLNSRGDELRKALTQIVEDLGLGYSVVGIASIFKIFFGEAPKNYVEALKCDKAGYLAFARRMLESGVFLPPSQFETNFLSAAHSEDVINETLEVYKSNLRD
ncbi:MAG: glutamate-1-semialdehyde 2,1-aminomutase [Methanothrix sp.]|jgi:glutamate-1-semialdehyde 2,1-aminomutase|uniref:Glutamate-1-semialdehyde 2,1-aminomutase n=1 Tax=Methanothrix harundinacea TaxID=301375 RepID=A0A117MC49_9EURY|nr:MAG: Glutamate-1-semialdehyde 2,1-aminomutase [Methanothrix harundinacea]MDD2638034.1 glutamate-1-semialdehyde 2,1-aminomutase [Methanothrix sp.]MDI9398301.1 glutamate-1-semialdehyde 2,1-aminomutase [Euryarchaeota archaeon]KUK95902.1 MAG: Glutamate-1-semialdehyde 2,1-aminomutase [Methanothrix harundinacea]MCP1392325.1 glutamate-1-semialdehyde 2,1-aminomutase [Methanothrix harundinacea]